VTASDLATVSGAPAVWDEYPDNISHVFEVGKKEATDAAFAAAAHIIKRKYVVSRVHAQYMEPRSVVGQYDPKSERCHGRCRRQFWNKRLAVCRASADAVGIAKGWQTGEMGM
jgi:CO/xanthine dehydrogenase Mo-binding subunit